MGLYESDHPDVKGMQGLHLFHFMMSNCSQRVRLALEEKGLDWTSHHLDLPGNEHITSDYHRINPNCVVPTLVHDGQVVIESNDILGYLDVHFPQPRLCPEDPDAKAATEACIAESSGFQPPFKVLSHELLFRPFRKIGAEELALYRDSHAGSALFEFMRDYSENGAAWKARVEQAHADLALTLDKLEARLEGAPWLSGDAYGLADISWVVNAFRLEQAQVDVSRWPRFDEWAKRAMSRPAFESAVRSYRP